MTLGAVEAALGGSLVAEELRGDLRAAAAAAGATLEAARASGEAASLADAATWAGAVALLRGEPRRARELALEAIGTGHSNELAAALPALAAVSAVALPTGDASASLALEAMQLPSGADAPSGVAGVLARLPAVRLELQTLRRAGADVTPVLDDELARIEASAPGWPFGFVAAADLCRRAGELARAEAALAGAQQAYAASADAAGEGLCQLIRGDWLVMPEGQLLSLGFELHEPRDTDTSERLGPAARHAAALRAPGPAQQAYARAEALFGSVGATRGVAAVELRRAALIALAGDPEAARTRAEAARELFDRAGDTPLAQLASAHAALARVGAGEMPEDRALAEQIGAWGRETGAAGWALGLGVLFSQAGWRALRGDGEADAALACHRLAEATFAALGAEPNRQQALADQAVCHRAVGNWRAATVAAGASGRVLDGLAAAHPDWIRSLSLRLVGLNLLRSDVAHAAGDADALEALRASLEGELALVEAMAPHEMPGLPPELLAEAREQHTRAVAALRARLDRDEVLALVYRAQRGPPGRRRIGLEKALAAAQGADADRGRLEALVRLEQGDVAAARQAYAAHGPPPEALQRRDALERHAATLVRVEAWREARAAHEALVALPAPESADPSPWLAIGDRARVAEGLGEPAALDLYEEALASLELHRVRLDRVGQRATFASGRGDAGLHAAAARAALLAAEAPDAKASAAELRARAFHFSERGKARGLLEQMAAGAAMRPAGKAERPLLREWRRLTARRMVLVDLAASNRGDAGPELDAVEAALADAEAALGADDPRWLRAVNPPAAVPRVEDIARLLGRGTVLIAHHLARDAVLGWAITADGLADASVVEVDAHPTDELLTSYLAANRDRQEDPQPFGEKLAARLLEPFDALIAASEHVVLAPHGLARAVPLQALPWRGEPLVANRSVSFLPSAGALSFIGGRAPAAPEHRRLLAVGDPAAMSYRPPGAERAENYEDLRWTGAQASETAGRFEGAVSLLGEAADEEAVRKAMPKHRLVHLGTHGLLDEAPLLSCVLLARGATLDAWELLEMDLDADLLALDACHTAGAPVTPGDEVVGVAWLALAAGARAVLASLWRVGEVPTALLMRALYAALREGRSPASAHAAAQRHVRELKRDEALSELALLREAAAAAGLPDPGEPVVPDSLAHPYHWAGFVLLGM